MAIRHQERFIADSLNPETKCAGGKSFDECETAQRLLDENRDFTTKKDRRAGDGGYNLLLYGKAICEACQFTCAISLEMNEGLPTGNAKLVCDPPET